MPRIKRHEEIVYRAVKSGELTHRRQWPCLAGAVPVRGEARPCLRRRAEHRAGPMLTVRAMFTGRSYSTSASRLVWRHSSGPIPPGMLVKHINGRESDNRPSNLELATPSQMQLHRMHVLGVSLRVLRQHGEPNHFAKL